MIRKLSLVLCCVPLLLIASATEAQYIGDALASAGVNMSEEDARSRVAARCQSVECNQRVEDARKAESGVGTMKSSATVPTMTSSTPRSAEQAAAEQKAQIEQLRREAGGATDTNTTQSTSASSPTRPDTSSQTLSAPPAASAGSSSGFAGAALTRAKQDPTEVAAWNEGYRSVGTRLSSKPDGESIKVAGQTYINALGVFYEQDGSSWVAVTAPIGATVSKKPLTASTHFANGKPVSYYYGTFYIYRSDLKRYQVVKPPAGIRVDYVPDTANKVTVDGTLYYKHGDTLFRPYYQGSTLVFVTA